jgi:phosphoribosylglycinamide formyltransferase-1
MSAEMTTPHLRLVLLTSRGGGHCMHIAERIAAGALPGLRLVAVITDNPSAAVIDKCRARNIDVRVVPWPGRALREQHDRELASALEALQADLVGLVGYLRLVGPTLVDAWRGRMFNLHPSLLPAYPGLNAIERAFVAGESRLGATVHWVDEGCDTGPVIVQRAIAPQPHEDLPALTERVHALEAQLLDEALGRLAIELTPRACEAGCGCSAENG